MWIFLNRVIIRSVYILGIFCWYDTCTYNNSTINLYMKCRSFRFCLWPGLIMLLPFTLKLANIRLESALSTGQSILVTLSFLTNYLKALFSESCQERLMVKLHSNLEFISVQTWVFVSVCLAGWLLVFSGWRDEHILACSMYLNVGGLQEVTLLWTPTTNSSGSSEWLTDGRTDGVVSVVVCRWSCVWENVKCLTIKLNGGKKRLGISFSFLSFTVKCNNFTKITLTKLFTRRRQTQHTQKNSRNLQK